MRLWITLLTPRPLFGSNSCRYTIGETTREFNKPCEKKKMPKVVSHQRMGNSGTGYLTQCENNAAQYEQRKAQCETKSAQCETDKAQCETGTPQCESQKAQCESHNAQCESDQAWSDPPRSKKSLQPILGGSLKNIEPVFQDRYHNLKRVPKHDNRFSGEHKSNLDNIAPVQWRAGLIAPRAYVRTSWQRHLSVRPHHTTDIPTNAPPANA